MRALIPAPWRTIVPLLASGALVLALIGGFAFGLPGVEDEVYFSYAEWWMYAATIAAIGACVPQLRCVDLGCRRAKLATFAHALLTAVLALGCAGAGVAVINARRAARAASYAGTVIPPGSENIIVSTATAAGIALVLVTVFGAGVGSVLSLVSVVALALVSTVVPEGVPLPVPAQPYQGPWWQPASVAEAAAILLVGLVVWAVFGGQLRPRTGEA